MLPLLLKQNELDSIHILASTIYQLNCSVDYINQYILNGKTTIKQNIAILNDTFSYLGYDELKLSISSGQVHLTHFNHNLHDNLLLHVAEYFVLDSPTYKTILVLQHEHFSHKDALLTQVHISESYLSKIMKDINDYIEPAQVSVISRKKEYLFDGPIANWIYIDFFTRMFFSLLASPFTTEQPKVTNQRASLNLPVAGDSESVKQDLLTVAITSFPEPEEGYFSDSEVLEVIHKILSFYQKPVTLPTGQSLTAEQMTLYTLYIRLASSHADSFQDRKNISHMLLLLYNEGTTNTIIRDTVQLVDYFYTQVYKSDQRFSDAYYEAVYFLLLKQLTYRVTHSNINPLFDLTPYFLPNSTSSLDPIGQRITHFYNSDINHLPLSHHTFKMIRCFKEQLFNELYTIVNTEKGQTVKIYIKMSYKLSQAFFIKKLLINTFKSDCVNFTDDIDSADLIISDHHLNTPHAAPLFYLVDSHSKETLNVLLSVIFNIIIDKKQEAISNAFR